MQTNTHAHPTFTGILNGFAAPVPMAAHAPLIRCAVHIKTEDGEEAYEGYYQSTFDAVNEAQERVWPRQSTISVKAVA